jgi:phage/plasmid-associated DNA primase
MSDRGTMAMTSEEHAALRVSLGVYALNKADDQECRAIREHLDRCADCQDELAELLLVVDMLDLAGTRRFTG